MIEIAESPEGWRWTLIGASGDAVAYGSASTQQAAFYAARNYRAAVWRVGGEVDHRQGCV